LEQELQVEAGEEEVCEAEVVVRWGLLVAVVVVVVKAWYFFARAKMVWRICRWWVRYCWDCW
jgi:hypothetical protein